MNDSIVKDINKRVGSIIPHHWRRSCSHLLVSCEYLVDDTIKRIFVIRVTEVVISEHPVRDPGPGVLFFGVFRKHIFWALAWWVVLAYGIQNSEVIVTLGQAEQLTVFWESKIHREGLTASFNRLLNSIKSAFLIKFIMRSTKIRFWFDSK